MINNIIFLLVFFYYYYHFSLNNNKNQGEYISLGLTGLSLLERICTGLSLIRSGIGLMSGSVLTMAGSAAISVSFVFGSFNQLLGCFFPMNGLISST